jgi:ribonuclease BN (tRNA processing enzyme)
VKLIVIGCASGMPAADRANSCYLIEASDRFYMFDCGDGAASALERCEIDTSRIQDIFISHTHPDHVIGLPMLIQMEHLKRRSEPLRIHVPSEFAALFSQMLNGLYLFPEKMCFDIEINPIDRDFEFDKDGVRVRTCLNPHLAGNADYVRETQALNLMQCFSFTIESGGRKLAYSADITGIEDLVEIADGADVLLTEGMHIDLTDLPNLLIDKKITQCVLTHLPDDFDRRGTLRHFEKSGFSVLEFAEEGMEIEF